MNKKYIIAIFILLVACLGGITFFLTRNNSGKISIENSAAKQTAPQANTEDIFISEEQEDDKPEEQSDIQTPTKQIAEESTNEAEVEVKDQEAQGNNSSDFIKQKLVSWGFTASSSRDIDTIIVHSSYDALGDDPYDVDGIIQEYKTYGVAAHYLIDRKGNVYQLVKDNNIAYHAGVSSVPDGRTNVNNFSIGIELINTKTEKCTANQYSSLNKLLDILLDNYKIKYILGHDEIAPGRKDDPWNFDWNKINAR